MAFSGGDPWSYTPPLSLWKLVEQNVSPEEQEEIRSMLGTDLVETTLDLHNEVEMLLEIWRDYQDETENDLQGAPKLAEPPHVRDRLVQEICFLADSVREKSLRKGFKPETMFSKNNSLILEYAEERSGSSMGIARPMSARSSDGRQTPLSPSNEASKRADLSSTIHEDVSSANKKLNYMHFDEVCTKLRETLTKEMEQLEADVIFLQGCLDNAADYRSHGGTPTISREPTIAELREERSLLEKELLSSEAVPSTPVINKPAFAPSTSASSVNKKMPSLGPINSRLRPAPRPNSGEASKSTPLKASHHLTHPAHSPDSASNLADRAHTSPTGAVGETASTSPRLGSLASGNNSNKSFIAHNYELDNVSAVSPQNMPARDIYRETEENMIRRRDGSGNRRRTLSPARVKVVPVGSILDPQADSAGGRSFIPTPPPGAEKPQIPRPSSADRFRKMVMQYREAT